MLTLALCAALLSPGQLPEPRAYDRTAAKLVDQYFGDVGIVRGTVEKIDLNPDETKDSPVTVRVEHVYRGLPGLKEGSVLVDWQAGENLFRNGRESLAWPPFTKGELGLWLVRTDGKKFYPAQEVGLIMPRLRKSQTDSYSRWVAWAEAVERLNPLTPNEQVAELRTVTRSKNPMVAAWAVHTLALDRSEAMTAYFAQLKEETGLTVFAQAALDQALCSREGKVWQQSVARSEMFRRWVASAPDEPEASLAISAISAAARDVTKTGGGLDPEIAAAALQNAVVNPKYPYTARLRAVKYLPSLLRTVATRDSGLACLVSILRQEKDPELREEAASAVVAIVRFAKASDGILLPPLNKRQLQELIEIAQTEKNELIAGELKTAITEVQKRKP